MPRTDPDHRRRALVALALAAPLPMAAHQLREWPADRAVPALGLKDLDGNVWHLTSLRGRAVLLNFWATWCEPCRAEMASLQRLAQRHAGDGVVVLTVNYQDSERTIRHFLQKLALALPVLMDPDGAATAAWTPRVLPSTVLIDRLGRPRRVVVGEADWGGPLARQWMNDLLPGLSGGG